MLFPQHQHEPIRSGAVTVAFRRWKRPTVSEGGTLQTPAGLLAIDELTPIAEPDITVEDARTAGFDTVGDLLDTLHAGDGRTLYRIRFRRIGDDPRLALGADGDLDARAVAEIDDQLGRCDAASRTGPWTVRTLRVIAARPAQSSRVLADEIGIDQTRLKRRVRRLKELGLTESLGTGYRLSPRGQSYLHQHERSRGEHTQLP